mmetsp:Transcript_10535/g.22315  ORF Transcript_10535/g.22315 Transcript_10535/m.22315 type:complete len:264 (-) Transcript_10535:66-857(-)
MHDRNANRGVASVAAQRQVNAVRHGNGGMYAQCLFLVGQSLVLWPILCRALFTDDVFFVGRCHARLRFRSRRRLQKRLADVGPNHVGIGRPDRREVLAVAASHVGHDGTLRQVLEELGRAGPQYASLSSRVMPLRGDGVVHVVDVFALRVRCDEIGSFAGRRRRCSSGMISFGIRLHERSIIGRQLAPFRRKHIRFVNRQGLRRWSSLHRGRRQRRSQRETHSQLSRQYLSVHGVGRATDDHVLPLVSSVSRQEYQRPRREVE